MACDAVGERDRVGDALIDNRETWLASRDPLIALRTVFVLAKNKRAHKEMNALYSTRIL